MSLDELASKYISSAEQVFAKVAVSRDSLNVNVESVRKVVDCAKDYLEDARYYMEKKKFEVSLTSVAYCEGLLDALRMLGAVSFEWPKKARKTRSAK
jgi:FAD synthetase